MARGSSARATSLATWKHHSEQVFCDDEETKLCADKCATCSFANSAQQKLHACLGSKGSPGSCKLYSTCAQLKRLYTLCICSLLFEIRPHPFAPKNGSILKMLAAQL